MTQQGPSFGSTGYDGVDDAQRQTDLGRKPKRFWLPKPEKGQRVPEREIIFLDENPFCFWEHQPMVNGQKWGNFFPCNQGVWPGDPTCVMCQNRGIDRYYIGLYTIIDCTEFTIEGKVFSNLRRILAAKLESIKLLRQKAITYKGLVGKRFLASRTSERSARIGNVFDYMGDEQLERDPQSGLMRLADRKFWWTNREGVQLAPEPYNYQEVYAAETNANLASLIGLKLPEQPQQQQQQGGDVFDRQIAQNQQQQEQQQQQQVQQQAQQPPQSVTGEVVDGVPPGAQQQPQQLNQEAPPPTAVQGQDQGQAPGDGQQGGPNNPVGYA
jgi:hypothetical protein